MKVLSLFSGIGAFEKALSNLGVDYELVNYCEIDKYASKSYVAIHNVDESMNLGDITKVDEKSFSKDIDLITYGFPCQDISISGRQKGLFNEDGTQTRSGLFFEALRIINEVKPRVAMAENVKNLTGKKFGKQFEIVLNSLEQAGYNSYWKVLNAKDYGVPQNRERVFIVSIRKDIDDGNFKFPDGSKLELRLKDIFEDKVDDKYYLKKVLNMDMKENYIQYDNSGKGHNSQAMRAYYQDGLSPTLPASNGGGNKSQVVLRNKAEIIRVDIPQIVKVRKYHVNCELLCECLRDHKFSSGFNNKEIAEKLNVPTTKVEHWFRQDKHFAIPEPEIWLKLKSLLNITTTEFDESIMTFEEKVGSYEKSERHYFADGISPTLTSTMAGSEKIITSGTIIDDTQGFDSTRYYNKYSPTLRASRSGLKTITDELEIRRLTPKECFRLMGFDDNDFEKAAKVNSNTQLYKQAGNSIVVNVLEALFKELKVYLKDDGKINL